MPEMCFPRAHCAATVVSGAIYAVGGCNSLCVERLDLAAPFSWELLASPMSCVRKVGCSVMAWSHALYVFGGCNKFDSAGTRAEKFDLVTMTWEDLGQMPSNHNYFSQPVMLSDGSIYLFGGSTSGAVSKFEPWRKIWKSLSHLWTDPQGGGCYGAYLLKCDDCPMGAERVDFIEERGEDAVAHSTSSSSPCKKAARDDFRASLSDSSSCLVEGTRSAFESEVIATVTHEEPLARIGAVEAAQFVAVQDAGFIERMKDSAPQETLSAELDPDQVICVSKIHRNTKQLRSALLEGEALRPYRDALLKADRECVHPTGALLFVLPSQYQRVVDRLVEAELKPDHLVFALSAEELIVQTLESCNACCKTGRQDVVLPPPSDVASQGSEVAASDAHVDCEDCDFGTSMSNDADSCTSTEQAGNEINGCLVDIELTVVRTFICARPVRDRESSVTASSTDAHLGKKANPRRSRLDPAFE
eukprot:TRINITY_DN54559_c0_g1_i1.p1 TRINITY_DN54559_c0_g1~~TRINITY_DN54559_c0_g1_i1.p1  ORF type:complete len:474 (-),score=47.85 TRINITY_DN54559_c0_g1_i1:240-1661(-)